MQLEALARAVPLMSLTTEKRDKTKTPENNRFLGPCVAINGGPYNRASRLTAKRWLQLGRMLLIAGPLLAFVCAVDEFLPLWAREAET
jgi:hypothetical protein